MASDRLAARRIACRTLRRLPPPCKFAAWTGLLDDSGRGDRWAGFHHIQDQFFTLSGVAGAVIAGLSGIPVTAGSVLWTFPIEGIAG